MRSDTRRRRRMIKASELAQLGMCEQLVVFDQLHGKNRTAQQRQAIERGNAAHRTFHRDAMVTERGVATSDSPRCFIATATFGELASETQALRRYRDCILARGGLGRVAISCYYRMSPVIAEAIDRSRILQLISRAILIPIVWLVRKRLQRTDRR